MKKLDLYWMSNRDWWEFVDNIPTIKASAPEDAKASYGRYLLETYEPLDDYGVLTDPTPEDMT